MRARQLKHEDDDDDDVGAQPLAATASHQLQKNDKAPVQTETLIISQNKLKKKQLATEIDHDEPFLARRDRPQEPVTKKKKRSKKNKKNEETLLQNQQRPCLLTLATAQHWEDSGVVETPNLLAQICKRSSENSLDEDHDGSSFLSADTGSVTRPGAIRIQGASIESSSSSGSDEGAVQQVVSNDQISSNTQRLVEAELAPDITLVEAQTAPDVDEVVDQAVNQAVQQMDERLKARKKRLIAFCVASIVIIAALVAALVVAKRDITAPGEVMTTPPSFNASATTNNPTSPPPTIKPTEDIDTKMLRIIGGIYPGEFPSTNDQEDALEWLSLDDKVAMLVNTEASNHHYLAVQRYCLALLFYMTDGLHWVRKYLWLSSQDVCDWEMLSCDDDQQVIRMSICKWFLFQFQLFQYLLKRF